MNEANNYVPRWGVGMTFGCLMSSKVIGFFGGSSTKTSKAAPPQWPDFNEFKSASSLTMPPRATLTMYTPFLHFAKVVELIKSVSNDWRVLYKWPSWESTLIIYIPSLLICLNFLIKLLLTTQKKIGCFLIIFCFKWKKMLISNEVIELRRTKNFLNRKKYSEISN